MANRRRPRPIPDPLLTKPLAYAWFVFGTAFGLRRRIFACSDAIDSALGRWIRPIWLGPLEYAAESHRDHLQARELAGPEFTTSWNQLMSRDRDLDFVLHKVERRETKSRGIDLDELPLPCILFYFQYFSMPPYVLQIPTDASESDSAFSLFYATLTRALAESRMDRFGRLAVDGKLAPGDLVQYLATVQDAIYRCGVLLETKAASERAGISRRQLARLVRNGEIRAIRRSGAGKTSGLWFNPSDIDRIKPSPA